MSVLVIGPAGGGVAHVARSVASHWPGARLMTVDERGRVESDCGCRPARPGGRSVASRARRAASAHRHCIRASSGIHVELGKLSVGAFWFAQRAARLAPRVPVVLVVHDMPTLVLHPAAYLVPTGPGWRDRLAFGVVARLLDRPVIAAMRRRAGATVVLGRGALAEAESGRWPRPRLILHGSAPAHADNPLPSAGDHVLLAGYLAPGKGLDILADAWPATRATLPLVIAGGHDAVHEGWYRATRTRLDSSRNAPVWTDFVAEPEFEDLIRRAAVVVLPYERSNPASGVLVRSVVEGRAVLATRTDAFVDEIRDGVDGLLVDPGDPQALADALDLLMAQPRLRDELGHEAAARAAERHTWQAHVAGLIDAHRELHPADPEDAR